MQGKIIDPGADTRTVEVNFRDDSAPCQASVNSDKTFSASHTYIWMGIYDLSVVARDDGGGAGSASEQVQVTLPPSEMEVDGGGVASSVYHDATLHFLFFVRRRHPSAAGRSRLHGHRL